MTLLTNTSQTMSSLEIADLTGKDHKHVLADTRNMCGELGINSAEFSAQHKDSSGKSKQHLDRLIKYVDRLDGYNEADYFDCGE